MEACPTEILQQLLNHLDFASRISLSRVSSYLNRMICVTNFLDLPLKCRMKLNDKILRQYPHITQLDANNNPNIRDISHLTCLKTLYVKWNCGILNDSLQKLNLTELHISHNPKIYNLGHMTNLKILYANWYPYTSKLALRKLNLTCLHVRHTNQAVWIGHMTNLKVLYMDDSIVNPKHLEKLNLHTLSVSELNYIKVNHMTNLKILHVNEKCKHKYYIEFFDNLNLENLFINKVKVDHIKFIDKLPQQPSHHIKNLELHTIYGIAVAEKN